MNYFTYDALTEITKTTKPYRGHTNRFPIARRDHGYKCFYVEQDVKGNNEYHIAYGHRWEEIDITEIEHLELIKSGIYTYKYNDNGIAKYRRHSKNVNIIGVVRSDNTFEFTCNIIGQGTRGFLTEMTRDYSYGTNGGYFKSDVKLGGMVYIEDEGSWSTGYKNTKVIPIFKGQRIDMGTKLSVVDYEIHQGYVNRKRFKLALAEYKDDLIFAEATFNNLSMDTFAEELKSTLNGVYEGSTKPANYWSFTSDDSSKILNYGKAHLKSDIMTAIYSFIIGRDIFNAFSIAMGGPLTYSSYSDGRTPLAFYNTVKAKFIRQLMIDNEVHDMKVRKANEIYTSNTWGTEIRVNNTKVKQYN